MFPCFPFLPLICSQTPTRPQHLAFTDVLVLPQQYEVLRLQFLFFRGSIAYLQQFLSTLCANISDDYTRLDSDGWLALTGQDWLPVGKLRGVSLLYIGSPDKSPPHGLARRNHIEMFLRPGIHRNNQIPVL